MANRKLSVSLSRRTVQEVYKDFPHHASLGNPYINTYTLFNLEFKVAKDKLVSSS